MGAGKTSVGRALGQRLNWLFEDLDDRIVQAEGRTVVEIFRDSGEQAFRRMEQEALERVLEELQAGSVKVVALGGGTFAQPGNVALLKASGVPTIFLDAPVEELWLRCREQAIQDSLERPLLQSIGQFRDLHQMRRKSYTSATLRIETGGRPIAAIAAEIAEDLGLKKSDGKKSGSKKVGSKQIPIRIEQGEVE
ncbi:MAG TPA: shikimate kinase [Terriglobales bacterium]|nr:shikimate kinase [Terriglobales bacterium]